MQKLTLGTLLHDWLEGYKMNLKPNTIRSYIIVIQLVVQHMGNKPIKNLDVQDYQNCFFQMQEDGISKSTIHTAKVVLNQAYKTAIIQHSLPDKYNPIPYTKVPSQAAVKQVVALTKEEQEIIESLCPKVKYGYAIQFILFTGLRNEEFRNLRWEDYDPIHHYLYIRKSKTPNGKRVIPLRDFCWKMIERQPHRSEFIFTQASGSPLTKTVLRKTYIKLRELSGIQTLTIHVLRHSFATRSLEKGVQVKAVSALLGHSSTAFTADRYQHADMDFLTEQLSILDKK